MIPATAVVRWGGDPARPEAEETTNAIACLCDYVVGLLNLAADRLEAHERRARGAGDYPALQLLDDAEGKLRRLGERLQDDPAMLGRVVAELGRWIAKLEAGAPGAASTVLAELRRVDVNARLAMLPEEQDPMPPEERARQATRARRGNC